MACEDYRKFAVVNLDGASYCQKGKQGMTLDWFWILGLLYLAGHNVGMNRETGVFRSFYSHNFLFLS